MDRYQRAIRLRGGVHACESLRQSVGDDRGTLLGVEVQPISAQWRRRRISRYGGRDGMVMRRNTITFTSHHPSHRLLCHVDYFSFTWSFVSPVPRPLPFTAATQSYSLLSFFPIPSLSHHG